MLSFYSLEGILCRPLLSPFPFHLTGAYACFPSSLLVGRNRSFLTLESAAARTQARSEWWVVASRCTLRTQGVSAPRSAGALYFRWVLCTAGPYLFVSHSHICTFTWLVAFLNIGELEFIFFFFVIIYTQVRFCNRLKIYCLVYLVPLIAKLS